MPRSQGADWVAGPVHFSYTVVRLAKASFAALLNKNFAIHVALQGKID